MMPFEIVCYLYVNVCELFSALCTSSHYAELGNMLMTPLLVSQ